ncbi:AraC family transcriptional regulator [Aquimarina brevivitae]|uniref:AraC family transcriptional regulator n=1 Tax=Aquimarina brevivitae TaxID=323412 RepID=A0A4V2F793_9FLAO|nr:helix-turn-helix domain-containing protein [Aquimarina brevivitae]RZS99019.1 AraC family transcriptional regulator [Aquimarina brevivitae]
MDFILHFGILANALLLYILWKNGLKEIHFRILFVIFLWILLTQISFFGFINEFEIIFYSAFLFQDTIPISIGPFLYLYIKAIFFPNNNIVKENYKHFIIPILYLLFASIPKLVSLIQKPDTFGHLREGLENLWALSNIYTLIYTIIALRILAKSKKLVQQYYADINANDLNWLQKFLYCTIFIFGIDISITIYEVVFGDISSAIGIIAFFVVFLIVYLAYHGISQTKVLLPEFLFQKEEILYKEAIAHKETSNPQTKVLYNSEEMDLLKLALEKLILEDKWYLIPELSLKSLSEELNIPDKKISYLLNQHMNVSFYDYINSLRVQEVKRKMLDPFYTQYTLLAIALECGFNSKTSFNRTFQRFEGITPSKYRRRNLNKQLS